MTVTNSFGPFGFNHWTVHDTDGGDDAADEVQRGEKNTLSGGDAGNATLIENSANVNMALAVQNFATGSGVVGVYGRSDGAAGGGIGVAGACDSGWGVAGVATVPTIDPRGFPNTVGVFGAGDWVGIYGQSRPKEGQLPSALPLPDPGTGIFRIGDVAGVEGDCDGAGAGIVGKSTGGKGVIGNSASGADIGVYGQSLASLPDSVAILPGTGVLGTGDNVGVFGVSRTGRGGVFSTGSRSDPPVAQAQLVPVEVQPADVAISAPRSKDFTPQLPKLGAAGDVLALTVPAQAVEVFARLSFCVKSGTQTEPAIWAEMPYSRTITGTGP
jgi:hypothetical protein